MKSKLSQQIRANMEARSTQDLLKIWEDNDRELWSEEAFEAVEQILTERGETLPPQKLRGVLKTTDISPQSLEELEIRRSQVKLRIGKDQPQSLILSLDDGAVQLDGAFIQPVEKSFWRGRATYELPVLGVQDTVLIKYKKVQYKLIPFPRFEIYWKNRKVYSTAKVPKWSIALILAPLIIFFGGIIPAFIGLSGVVINVFIMRSRLPTVVKFVMCIIVVSFYLLVLAPLYYFFVLRPLKGG